MLRRCLRRWKKRRENDAPFELAYDLGLINTELPFTEAQRHFRIDDDALGLAGRQDFSKRLRQGL